MFLAKLASNFGTNFVGGNTDPLCEQSRVSNPKKGKKQMQTIATTVPTGTATSAVIMAATKMVPDQNPAVKNWRRTNPATDLLGVVPCKQIAGAWCTQCGGYGQN